MLCGDNGELTRCRVNTFGVGEKVWERGKMETDLNPGF